jgi:urease accessory protein
VRAHAAVVAAPSDDGCSFPTLRSDPPLLLRPTPFGLFLQGGAAGPLGGDRLRLDVEVRAGARLTVRSAAATIVLPGGTPSELAVSVRVEEGAHLDWMPEPLVSVAGSHHVQRIDIALAQDATMRWHERFVLGRTGEPPGRLDGTIRVERGGVALLHQQLRLGDRDDRESWMSAAVVGDARAVVSEVRVGERAPDAPIVRRGDDGFGRSACLAVGVDATLLQAIDRDLAAASALVLELAPV